MSHSIARPLAGVVLAASLAVPAPCAAQAPAPAAPADTPSIKVGTLIFADYTIQQQPKIKDADGNEVTFSAFQIGRAYINVTGNITKNISFRITPDIARESGVGSSLNGSYTFRLKFAYAQWGFDDHLTKGSYARFGMQPTVWSDFFDTLYRYRFQGPTFEDREGYLLTSDAGASFHYNLPGNFGDVHAALFNGEAFTHAEANDQKSVQLRGSLRPAPGHPVLQGLRITGYWNHDAYVKNADRHRAIVALTFEHPHLNGGFNYFTATDQMSATKRAIDARGWSAFVTPRTTGGWEGLLRFDHLEPDQATDETRQRTIAGVAYWFPHQGSVSTALMFDVDNLAFDGFTPAQSTPPTQRKFAVHAQVSF